MTFDPTWVYYILASLAIIGTCIGFFFNLKSEIAVLKSRLQNAIDQTSELKQKTAADYSKIEKVIADLENKSEDRHKDLQSRIDKMPIEIITLLRSSKE